MKHFLITEKNEIQTLTIDTTLDNQTNHRKWIYGKTVSPSVSAKKDSPCNVSICDVDLYVPEANAT